jgi:lipopolysaccharide export system permease protein
VTILMRYIILGIYKSIASVLAVLVLVGGIIQLVGQFEDVGIANYGLSEAFVYVLLGMPRMVFQILPAAAVIGTLMALGNLAVHHELTVIRASGVSKFQLILTVGLAGFVLTVLMALLGESFAPSLGAYARELRTQALHDDLDTAGGQSTWLKDGSYIFNLQREVGDLGFGSGVNMFEITDDHRLVRVAQADSADVDSQQRWVLANYAETRFDRAGIAALHEDRSLQSYDLSPDLLNLSIVRHDLLDTPGLQRYIGYLKANDLDADRYLIAYWGRIANVLSVTFMTLLALPFVFSNLRSAGTGARLIVGLIIGLGFYVIDETFANSGEVFDIDPVVVAWIPTSGLIVVTVLALARMR